MLLLASFSAREGSGVFSTRGAVAAAAPQAGAGFSAREGSGVFSTSGINGSRTVTGTLVSAPVRALGSFLLPGFFRDRWLSLQEFQRP